MPTNFTITRGDTWSLSGSATLGGDPYDLAGCTLYFTVKYKHTDSEEDAVFQKSTGSGITHTNPTNGLYTVSANPADTTGLTKTRQVLVWDCQLVTAGGAKYTLNYGNLVVLPDVTNT